jgi:hypothetical protein
MKQNRSKQPVAKTAEDLVLTPGGLKPRSQVHYVEPAHIIDGSGQRLRKLHPQGRVVADYGKMPIRPGREPLLPKNVRPTPGPAPTFGSGWIVYAGWNNDTGQPISSFRTTWVVPPPPTTQSGQTIFLFNGIQNSTMIYQPVLQWGPSAAGGGNYWTVASWYADGQTGQSFHSSLVPVNPGDVLIGVMTLTGRSGANFNYSCSFEGIANTTLPIQNVQELTWAVETLEAYGITACSDYPNTYVTAMQAISLQTGTANPNITWAPVNAVTDCGQHIDVVSNSATSGEVDLYYHVSTTSDVPVPLYRYWNAVATDHFYTTNWNELGSGNYGWRYEGIQCYVHAQAQLHTVPLYRYWNGQAADHFYTTDWRELGSGNYGWAYEGIQCYVHPTPTPQTVPLYRYWNGQIADHFYTTNWGELGYGNYGWVFEGIQCYVHSQPNPDPGVPGVLAKLAPEEGIPASFRIANQPGMPPIAPPPTFQTFGGPGSEGVPKSFRVGGGQIPDSFRVLPQESGTDQPQAKNKITITLG